MYREQVTKEIREVLKNAVHQLDLINSPFNDVNEVEREYIGLVRFNVHMAMGTALQQVNLAREREKLKEQMANENNQRRTKEEIKGT